VAVAWPPFVASQCGFHPARARVRLCMYGGMQQQPEGANQQVSRAALGQRF
jgi:hypothetical protein